MMNGSAIRTGACFHWKENPRCDQVQALNNIAAVELIWPDNSRFDCSCQQTNTTCRRSGLCALKNGLH
jgi:predicted GNAT superfamily acetyltransferase